MSIIYSEHSLKRMKQRGITELEVNYILNHPIYLKNSFAGRKEACGQIKNRVIRIEFIQEESYIKIITII